MKKVMVFGVFDGVHEGHKEFFKQARKHGDYLIAVLTQDHVVERLKLRLPKKNFAERFDHLKKEDIVDEIVIGDAELGTYDVVKRHKPDVIALGYDQAGLGSDIEHHKKEFNWQLKIEILKPFEPEKYHSSLLDKENI